MEFNVFDSDLWFVYWFEVVSYDLITESSTVAFRFWITRFELEICKMCCGFRVLIS